MLDPTHPDVAKALHLLDPCDVCGGDTVYSCVGVWGHFLSTRLRPGGAAQTLGQATCPACDGHGKALHPDRVIHWYHAERGGYPEQR